MRRALRLWRLLHAVDQGGATVIPDTPVGRLIWETSQKSFTKSFFVAIFSASWDQVFLPSWPSLALGSEVILAFLLVPFAYAIGLALQMAGEFLGIHSASPYPRYMLFIPTGGRWRRANLGFEVRLAAIRTAPAERWGESANRQRERYVVLKELSGNFASATFLFSISTYITGQILAPAVAIGILAVLLYLSHVVHARRQARFEIDSLSAKQQISQDEANAMRDMLRLPRRG